MLHIVTVVSSQLNISRDANFLRSHVVTQHRPTAWEPASHIGLILRRIFNRLTCPRTLMVYTRALSPLYAHQRLHNASISSTQSIRSTVELDIYDPIRV